MTRHYVYNDITKTLFRCTAIRELVKLENPWKKAT